jgi:Mrp family chromosome partitioning ATPase
VPELGAMKPMPERWAVGPSITESVWRYKWLVAAVALVMGLAGYFGSAMQPDVYEASAELFLTNPGNAGVFGAQRTNVNLDRHVPQQAERITSTPVLELATEGLGTGISPAELRRHIRVSGDPELAVLRITGQGHSASRAAEFANAVAAAYEESVRSTETERLDRVLAELDASVATIEEQITALGGPEGDAAAGQDAVAGQISVLTQRLLELEGLGQQLLVDTRLFGSGVEYLEVAQPPSSPVAPRPRRTAVLAALLGASMGAALAYWLAGRTRKIRSRDEPGQVLGVPLLGVLPTYEVMEFGTLTQRTTLDAMTAEAYRFVSSSLQSALAEMGARSVMITSASPSTGKTETALQLAALAQRRGRRVLLIDADLRMHGLSTFLRAERAEGLLDIASPERTRDHTPVTSYPQTQHHHLDVLTVGRSVNADEDSVNERWFGPAFEEAVDDYELVVVDSPPLLAVADTTTIAGYTDAIVLVIKEGSGHGDLERVQQRLSFVRQRLVGYVYLSPTALHDTSFDYGLVRSRAWEDAAPSVEQPETSRGGGTETNSDRSEVPSESTKARDQGTLDTPSSRATPSSSIRAGRRDGRS